MHKVALYIRANLSILVVSENWRSKQTHLRLSAELGSYDEAAVHAIIDEAPTCHISATLDGAPYIQAADHWRDGENVHVHGSVSFRILR